MQHRCQSLTIAIVDIRNELRSTCNDPAIIENLELTEQERCLLRKGLLRIPTRAHDDEYTEKVDCKRFFRRLRLKAHFSSDPSNARRPSQPSNKCEDPFKTIKHFPTGHYLDYKMLD